MPFFKQEVQLLLRNSQLYLVIYSFKQKSAFDAFLFWCMTSVQSLWSVVFGRSRWVQGLNSTVYLAGHFLSPVQCSDTFAVGCIIQPQSTLSQTTWLQWSATQWTSSTLMSISCSFCHCVDIQPCTAFYVMNWSSKSSIIWSVQVLYFWPVSLLQIWVHVCNMLVFFSVLRRMQALCSFESICNDFFWFYSSTLWVNWHIQHRITVSFA